MDPASSHVGIRHMAEDRRMSGQNCDRKRQRDRKNKDTMQWQFGGLVKM